MIPALSALLEEVLPAPVEITDLDRLTAGASAQLTAITARDGAGIEHSLVMRRDGAEAGMAIGTRAEARLLTHLGGASDPGLPIPHVVVAFDEHPELGSGYVMRRLSGETLPKRLLRDAEFEGARTRVLDEGARALAALHRTPTDDVEFLPEQGAQAQLDLLAGAHRGMGQASPTFEVAISWLRQRMPGPGETRVVHGDFRNGNLMLDSDGLVGVLDWELAHRGDPIEDLAWFCAPAWRFGGPGEAGGFGSQGRWLDAYESAAGHEVDRDTFTWWHVLACLKWGVICQIQASRHLQGGPSLEHAVIGRRVTETELDLLLVLDGVGGDA